MSDEFVQLKAGSIILPVCPELDLMLEREQCAAWLKVTKGWLEDDARLDEPNIPVFRIGHKTVRYHPRTIIAALANRAKISPAVLAASFGLVLPQTQN